MDANELVRDWRLLGTEIQLLTFLKATRALTIAVPESVIVEVVSSHARALAEAVRTHKRSNRLFQRLGVIAGPSPAASNEIPYEQVLRQRLELIDATILPWPKPTHEELTRRAAERIPPFNQTGGGYRDTLLWYSCLDLAARGHDVLLVTKDAVFAGKDGALSEALQKETEGVQGKITLVRELGPWLSKSLPWKSVSLKEAADRFVDEEFMVYLAPWDRFEDSGFTAEELGLPSNSKIEDPGYYSSGELERIAAGPFAAGVRELTFKFYVEFETEVVIDKEYALLETLVWHETEVLDRVKTTLFPKMWVTMKVEFRPEGDPDIGYFQLISEDWRPEVSTSYVNYRSDPGPGQPVLEFDESF